MSGSFTWRQIFDARILVPSVIVFLLASYWVQAWSLSEGARLFPAMVSAALIAMLLGILYNAVKDGPAPRQEEATDAQTGGNLLRAIFIIGNLICIWLWQPLGAPIGIFLGMAFSSYVFGARHPLVLIVLPAAVAAALYAIFVYVLEARLPLGIWLSALLQH